VSHRSDSPLSSDLSHHSVIPVYIGYCAVFKVLEEARTHDLQVSAEAQ